MQRRTQCRLRERTTEDAGSRGGFTLIELLVVLAIALLLGLLLLPATGYASRTSRQLRDSTQVRGILQGLVIWSQNNQDDYPLPSSLDVSHTTVDATGSAKDTSSHICSILVFHGFVPTELFVGHTEASGFVEEYRDYEFDTPQAAVNAEAALWDPAFHATPLPAYNIATPTNPGDVANNSYAYTLATGRRAPLWASTFVATEVAMGNRGPAISEVSPVDFEYDRHSVTLLLHGDTDRWVGNVGYNDNHVSFELRPNPEGLTYRTADGAVRRDVIFFDEPDDPTDTNAFLGVWAAVGDSMEDCVNWID